MIIRSLGFLLEENQELGSLGNGTGIGFEGFVTWSTTRISAPR